MQINPVIQNTIAPRAEPGKRTGPVEKTERVPATRDAHDEPGSEEYRQLQQLKARDREVRQHEQAHIAAGGQYVKGGADFSYQRGPDGRNYAVGGEVQIDTSTVRGDPEATLRKMETVQRAAMAPGEPSAQDRAVAAQASQTAMQARADLQREQARGEDRPTGQRARAAYNSAAAPPELTGRIDLQA